MGIGDIVTEKKKQVDEWLKNQSVPVEIAAISAGSAVQGTRERDRFFFSHFVSLSGGDDQLITRSLLVRTRHLIPLSLSILLRRTNRWRARLRARDGEQKPRGTSGDEPGDGESTGDVRRHVGTAARVGGELSGIYRRPRRVDVLD